MIATKLLVHPHVYGQRDETIELGDLHSTYVRRFVGSGTIQFPVLRTLTNEQYAKLTESIRYAK